MGEQPSQPLGTPAALSVLLAFNPVQAAKTEGRERLRGFHTVPGTPLLSLSRAKAAE